MTGESGYISPSTIGVLLMLAGFAYLAGHVVSMFLQAGRGLS